jgi:hypothetical protein
LEEVKRDAEVADMACSNSETPCEERGHAGRPAFRRPDVFGAKQTPKFKQPITKKQAAAQRISALRSSDMARRRALPGRQ